MKSLRAQKEKRKEEEEEKRKLRQCHSCTSSSLDIQMPSPAPNEDERTCRKRDYAADTSQVHQRSRVDFPIEDLENKREH
ncbi:hypothetical protein LDENG_00038410 [Lucifuga dentata]|nr:hypothetical protein LDENG_00038410 [Lucifuga dentata]